MLDYELDSCLNSIQRIFVLMLCFHFSRGQVWTWDTVLNEKGIIQTALDNQRNVLTYTKLGNEITRYTNSLRFDWKLKLPSKLKISSLACLHDQSFYLLGSFTDTISLDLQQFISKGSEDIILMRINAWGELIWSKQMGSAQIDLAGEVAVSGFNALITGGLGSTFFYDNVSFPKQQSMELFVAEIKSDGSLSHLQVAKHDSLHLSYNYSIGREIAVSVDGSIFLIARVNPHMKFAGLTLPPNLNFYELDQTFIKLDKDLNGAWIGDYSKYGSNYYYLTVNSKNEIYYVDKQNLHHQGEQCSLNKIEGSGQVKNVFGMPTNYWSSGDIGDICIDNEDNVTIGGYFSRWGSVKNNEPLGSCLFVRQFSATDDLIWQISDSLNAISYAICRSGSLGYLVSGRFYDSLTLTKSKLAVDSIYWNSSTFRKTNGFLALIDPSLTSSLGDAAKAHYTNSTFPNPSNGLITVESSADGVLNVFDSRTTKVYERALVQGSNLVDLSRLSPGIYLVEMRSTSKRQVRKIVIH